MFGTTSLPNIKDNNFKGSNYYSGGVPIGTYYHFYSQFFLWRPFVLTKYRWTTYFVNLKVFSYNRLDV